MNRLRMLGAVYACVFAFLFTPVNAALIDFDWNASNDSALLLDTTTGLHWLDLSVTANQSYNEVLAQLQQGGAYDGFRYATRDEVLHLWSEANITDTDFKWVVNGEWQFVKDLADRLGTSILFDPHGVGTHALGLVEGVVSLPANERRIMELSYHSNGDEVRTSSNYYTLDIDFSSIHYSSYLVHSVPIPPAFFLFCSGLLGLAGMARRKPRLLKEPFLFGSEYS